MVETENRYFEEGMEFVSFFMFVAWNALLTNLTFGKGESQTANHSLSFDSLMSTTLFIYLLYFLLLIQKHFTTISIEYFKSKTKKKKIFGKITGCLTKMFYRLLFRKLDIGCKRTKTSTNTNYL